MATVASIPTQGFVIIWVTTMFCGNAYNLRGTHIYLVSCAPWELADVRDKYPHNQTVFADAEKEAWQIFEEITERVHRPSKRMQPTRYCQVGANAA